MGTDRIGNSGSNDGFFAKPLKKKVIDKNQDNAAVEKTSPVNSDALKFKTSSTEDQAQASKSARSIASARGDDDLNLKADSAWASHGADFKLDPIAVQEPSLQDLSQQATAAIDQLRSISDEAVEESQTYQQLFNLTEDEDFNLDV